QGAPPSPRIHVPELDAIWEASILRCLERRPADRFGNVEDVVKALSGETVIKPLDATWQERLGLRIGPRRFAVMIVAVLVLALLAGALIIRNKPNVAGFKSRRSIAVLGFKNLTGEADAAWLSTALAEMLTTE